MKDLAQLRGLPFEAHGHCRVDYTDPVTGHVLERIEGDNHVFIDQFLQQDWQAQALRAMLMVTEGDQELDTDLPFIPGDPIAYGNINSAANGICRGSYRYADSFYNRVANNKVSCMYVYDFLHTQILGKIGYVGLTANHGDGVGSALYQYKFGQASYEGMLDIERNLFLNTFTCSLSSSQGGAGEISFYKTSSKDTDNVRTKVDLFALADSPDYYGWSGYQATWGYDYENQYVVLKLMRYRQTQRYYNKDGTGGRYWYTWTFRDDIYVFDLDGTQCIKHFTYEKGPSEEVTTSSWQYMYGMDASGNHYMRLYGDTLFFFSKYNANYQEVSSYEFVRYKYDITIGDVTSDIFSTKKFNASWKNRVYMNQTTAFFYKGYFFGRNTNSDSNVVTENYFLVNPMFNVYDDNVYTLECINRYISSYSNYMPILKGLTNLYRNTWVMKPSTTNSGDYGRPSMPFAYTAYKLPSDAPERPENSAVTIAYGLTINW